MQIRVALTDPGAAVTAAAGVQGRFNPVPGTLGSECRPQKVKIFYDRAGDVFVDSHTPVSLANECGGCLGTVTYRRRANTYVLRGPLLEGFLDELLDAFSSLGMHAIYVKG